MDPRALLAAAVIGLGCNPTTRSEGDARRQTGVGSGPPSAEGSTAGCGSAVAASPAPTTGAAKEGFAECEERELTGAPPAERICRRPRSLEMPDACCIKPVDVVILSGELELLRVGACSFVPPECAHRHGHGRMSAQLRFVEGSPPEVVVVEGGCEMRAIMHHYVPPGVPAWAGCQRTHHRWDGKSLVKIPAER